ncbi:MAG: PqqD family protein [Bacteroidaceae bacterium]|nr:PqqD family protein [Bacteroidaceae bacterium]
MHIKEGFSLRDVCGEKIVVGTGEAQIDFSKVINLNSTAAYLWEAVEGKEFDEEDLAGLLLSEYDTDKETAIADSRELISQWKKAGLVE